MWHAVVVVVWFCWVGHGELAVVVVMYVCAWCVVCGGRGGGAVVVG